MTRLYLQWAQVQLRGKKRRCRILREKVDYYKVCTVRRSSKRGKLFCLGVIKDSFKKSRILRWNSKIGRIQITIWLTFASCSQLMTSAFSILLPCPHAFMIDRKQRSMPPFHICRSSQGLSDHHQTVRGQQGWDLIADMSNSMVRQLILVNWEILKKIDWSRVRKIPLSPGEEAKFVSKYQYVDEGEQTFFTERSPRIQDDSENACRHGWMSTNCPERIKLRIMNQL